MKSAKNSNELKNILEELFLPIAPTLQIYHEGEIPIEVNIDLPDDTTKLKQIAWQHLGVWLSKGSNMYKSVRINRPETRRRRGNAGFGTATRSVIASPYYNKEIRLSAAIRADVEGQGNNGHLWMRVDMPNKKYAFFDNMDDRPITNNEWNKYELSCFVPDSAERIVFGCFLEGNGEVFLDDVKLEFKDLDNQWKLADIQNGNFESGDLNAKPHSWGCGSIGYIYKLFGEDVYEGEKCLLIKSDIQSIELADKIFDTFPRAGEVIDKKITNDFRVVLPISLLGDDNSTYPLADEKLLKNLKRKLESLNMTQLDADDENVRFGNIIIAWNIFQHFYPYFDVVKVDWENVLKVTLKEVLQNKNEYEFYKSLSKMVAFLEDGHGVVTHKNYYYGRGGGLPIRVEWIENNIVITASEDSLFRKGNIIKEIDGVDAQKHLNELEKYVSGSPQLKRYRALTQFGEGELNSIAKLIIQREDEETELNYKREGLKGTLFFNPISEFSFPNIKKLDNDIYYVNLSSTPETEFIDSLAKLLDAKGIIFDERSDYELKSRIQNIDMRNIVSLLIDEPVNSELFYVPNIIYPDRDSVEFSNRQWQIKPNEKHINAKVVFIVDPHVVSSGETFMGIVENYKLADIVGSTTAGCNGNANFIILPGGFRVMWTGMKVLKHDGSQHHLIGIEPTYPVQKTIKAVKEGRDEYLEKAIEVIMNSQ